MRITRRTLARLLLSWPLLLIILFALFYFIPGLRMLASEVFWELLGEWNIFLLAKELLKSVSSANQINVESFLWSFASLLLSAALDAIYIGCCIFIFQSTSIKLLKVENSNKTKRWYNFDLSRPKWLITMAGVCLAVFLNYLFGRSLEELRATLKGVTSIILLIFGIVTVLRAGDRIHGKNIEKKTNKNLEAFLFKLTYGILINAVKAVAAVNLITLVMTGPQMLYDDAHVLPLLMWLVCSVGLMLFCDLFDVKD